MRNHNKEITSEQRALLVAALKVCFDLLIIKREWEYKNHLAFFASKNRM